MRSNLITFKSFILLFISIFTEFTNAINLEVTINSLNAEIVHSMFKIKFKSGDAHSLIINNTELIGPARGFYSSVNGDTLLNATDLVLTTNTSDMIDIAYVTDWGELHYVVRSDTNGVYSYYVSTSVADFGLFRTLYRVDGNIFRNGYNSERYGSFPTLADIENGTTLQDETWLLSNGKPYTKYDWASYVAADSLHGVYGSLHPFGVWMISASHEYVNGGPLRQQLLVHVESKTGDGVVLNVVSDPHFGAQVEPIPANKIYGAWLVYFNNGSIEDAKSQAIKQTSLWPYRWLSNPYYPLSRTVVSGTLKLTNGQLADKAMVVLAKPGSDYYSQGSDYIFYAQTNSSGYFSIPHVRSGNYSLYAYSMGANIGHVTNQYVRNNISVSGLSLNLGILDDWLPTVYSHLLWQIGFSDRKSGEFMFGNSARQYGLFNNVPNDLNYMIGKSNYSNDWYYAQTKPGVWSIIFSLNQTYSDSDTAFLTVAMAGQSRTPTVQVIVNNISVITLPKFTNDMSIYRSALQSGAYHIVVANFSTKLLHQNAENIISLKAVTVNNGGGIMYDTIKLEVN